MGDTIQLYKPNVLEDATISVTTNSDSKEYMVDNDNRTYYMTQNADTTTQYWTFTFTQPVDITHVFLLKNNIPTGVLQKQTASGGAWSTITSWSSDVDPERKIATGSITIYGLRLQASRADVGELWISEFIACELDFELQRNPENINYIPSVLNTQSIDLDGKLLFQKHGQAVMRYEMQFNNLGSTGSTTDATNIMTLLESRESRLVNLCGDTEQTNWPYRWQDIKKMVITNDTQVIYSAGVASCGDGLQLNWEEIH